MSKVIIILLSLTITSCVGGVSKKESKSDEFFEERSKSLDITELINSLVQNYDLADWGQAATYKQIDWITKGIDDENNKSSYPFLKKGKVYITMSENFTHTILEDRKRPVPWEVSLFGARGGYVTVILDNNVYSQEFCGFEDYFAKQKILEKSETLESSGSSSGVYDLKLTLNVKGRRIIVFESINNVGTAGCSTSLSFNSNGSDKPIDYSKL